LDVNVKNKHRVVDNKREVAEFFPVLIFYIKLDDRRAKT
jgi:hypothetical protein